MQFTWNFATIWKSPFQKKRMFSFFRFWHFSRENDVTEFPPNFVFVLWDIYWWFPKEVTTRMSKVKKFFKYTYPFKRYSVLKVQFSAILLLKIAQNGRKFKFKNAISFEWTGIFQIFFTFDIPVVTSFRDHH